MAKDTLRLFSYKMTHDTGFAPNPFFGFLTLATCKPGIRRTKREGDWIAGFTSGRLCGDPTGAERLVFLMQVSEKLRIAEYFGNAKFKPKVPSMNGSDALSRSGDNIYRPIRAGAAVASDFQQIPNPHHWDGAGACSPHESRTHDVGGQFVLVAAKFAYFGRNPLDIPEPIRPEIPRGQSPNGSLTHDRQRALHFIDFVFKQAGGESILAAPHFWPADDDSWKP